ncbi:hypothetical protein PMG71_17850 [Roseofilum sp. BLCC_M154]|uniref:Uncharacterized protein n=1 Tax=Roseofilum acuticapitatum BLCC-M154 TaxID=3022444 RepID=A0ABT7AWN1_9CYAN|nr:hypothetical protein [Roseofilum acuticapitatum]MDJ1171296.1 hypothetical protein [Roseofilum acuticapitatum BLCC-M154]
MSGNSSGGGNGDRHYTIAHNQTPSSPTAIAPTHLTDSRNSLYSYQPQLSPYGNLLHLFILLTISLELLSCQQCQG